jgi:hypothetical protein
LRCRARRLRARPAPPTPGSSAHLQPGEVVKDLGTFDGVARELRESPFPVELDVHDVADGGYQLGVEVSNDSTPLGASTLNIALRKGLDDLAGRPEADSGNAPEPLRAEILFRLDRMPMLRMSAGVSTAQDERSTSGPG